MPANTPRQLPTTSASTFSSFATQSIRPRSAPRGAMSESSERATRHRTERQRDLRQAREPCDAQQRKRPRTKNFELGDRRRKLRRNAWRRRQAEQRVVTEKRVHASGHVLAQRPHFLNFRRIDGAGPAEPLGDAGTEMRIVRLDPGAMSLADFVALQDAEYFRPSGRIAGIDADLTMIARTLP